MNGFGMMSAGLGMTQGATNMMGSQMMKKPNRRIQREGDQMRQENQDYQQNEMSLGQQDVNRDFAHQAKTVEANDTHRLGPSSSVGPMDQKLVADERARRYSTIQRRKDLDASNFEHESEIIKSQRAIKKMQDTMALINGSIQGGANGAAESYTSRTY